MNDKTEATYDFSSFREHSATFFLQSVVEKQSHEVHYSDPLTALICEEYVAICRDFDLSQLQESWSWRNTHIARELANTVLDEKGEINKRALLKAIQLLEKNLFSLGLHRHHDAPRQQHLLKILNLFYQNKEYAYALKRVSHPAHHPGAERLIRETLFLHEGFRLTDAHARRAAFAALLTSLRQNVGSCFATAPAILIQQDQPLHFLADVAQLLAVGRLSRVVEGVEYVVPLSFSWGVGDLVRPILLSSLGNHPERVLSFSPGLTAAFEAASLVDKKLTRHEKQKKVEELLKATKQLEQGKDPFALITADQMIKEVLLHAFGITEQDVIDFRERSIQGPFAALVIQAPSVQSGKTLACSRYIKASESARWAFKALTDNALLKAWEFSLASLSESKADFAKWNLYTSLGVQPEDPHGIGEALYGVIQEKIKQMNVELEASQSRYDHLFAQAKYLEGRMTRADTDREAGWVQAEYQIRRHELNRVLSERDEIYEKGRRLQGLYPVLLEFYGKKIRDYFQEVYDAEMHDISANPYDDSPAGFRLMYKHGRSNTALWTMVNSAAEYIQNLTSFFISTEIELNQLPQFEGLQHEISALITAAIATIKRPAFLESSFIRLAKAYGEPLVKNPLQNLDKVKRKPWAYISGGTMSTLVSAYWGKPDKPKEEKRWVESENELLAFFIDLIKESPSRVQRKFQADPTVSLLAFSPTHAFLCKPGWESFKTAWEEDAYTYTWIRDRWVAPQQRFLDGTLLDPRMMETITEELLQFIPFGYRPIVKNALPGFSFSMTPSEFREHLLKTLSYEKWLQGRLNLIAEEIDSILHRFIPLFPEYALREKLLLLFQEIPEIEGKLKEEVEHYSEAVQEHIGKYKILTAEDLKNIAKGVLILSLKNSRSSTFYHQKIVRAMQKAGLCFPEPILFADTNWVKNVFGFTINPGTRHLEFWRFDLCGQEGRPISVWKRYLNGTDQQEWGLYTAPHQYGQFN